MFHGAGASIRCIYLHTVPNPQLHPTFINSIDIGDSRHATRLVLCTLVLWHTVQPCTHHCTHTDMICSNRVRFENPNRHDPVVSHDETKPSRQIYVGANLCSTAALSMFSRQFSVLLINHNDHHQTNKIMYPTPKFSYFGSYQLHIFHPIPFLSFHSNV